MSYHIMPQQRLFNSAGFSGRVADCIGGPILTPKLRPSRSSKRWKQQQIVAEAQTSPDGGFGRALKNFAKQVQGALPVVGLISRLAAPSGGIGSDETAYPEYARLVLDQAEPAFNRAVAEWEKRHDRVGQRRYILFCLWMARSGLGLVPTKNIGNAAMRLRVTHDLGMEMERYENDRDKALQAYSYGQRPKGKSKEQIDIAVDSLCKVSLGIKDGDAIPKDDQQLLVPIISHAFNDVDGIEEMVKAAISDAARAERKLANS